MFRTCGNDEIRCGSGDNELWHARLGLRGPPREALRAYDDSGGTWGLELSEPCESRGDGLQRQREQEVHIGMLSGERQDMSDKEEELCLRNLSCSGRGNRGQSSSSSNSWCTSRPRELLMDSSATPPRPLQVPRHRRDLREAGRCTLYDCIVDCPTGMLSMGHRGQLAAKQGAALQPEPVPRPAAWWEGKASLLDALYPLPAVHSYGSRSNADSLAGGCGAYGGVSGELDAAGHRSLSALAHGVFAQAGAGLAPLSPVDIRADHRDRHESIHARGSKMADGPRHAENTNSVAEKRQHTPSGPFSPPPRTVMQVAATPSTAGNGKRRRCAKELRALQDNAGTFRATDKVEVHATGHLTAESQSMEECSASEGLSSDLPEVPATNSHAPVAAQGGRCPVPNAEPKEAGLAQAVLQAEHDTRSRNLGQIAGTGSASSTGSSVADAVLPERAVGKPPECSPREDLCVERDLAADETLKCGARDPDAFSFGTAPPTPTRLMKVSGPSTPTKRTSCKRQRGADGSCAPRHGLRFHVEQTLTGGNMAKAGQSPCLAQSPDQRRVQATADTAVSSPTVLRKGRNAPAAADTAVSSPTVLSKGKSTPAAAGTAVSSPAVLSKGKSTLAAASTCADHVKLSVLEETRSQPSEPQTGLPATGNAGADVDMAQPGSQSLSPSSKVDVATIQSAPHFRSVMAKAISNERIPESLHKSTPEADGNVKILQVVVSDVPNFVGGAGRTLHPCTKEESTAQPSANPQREREAKRGIDAKFTELKVRGLLRRCAPTTRLNREDLQRLVALAQVEAKFIVARLGCELLVLVDQHAAAERVELEKLQRRVLDPGTGSPDVEAVPVQAGRGVLVPVTTEELRWLQKHRAHAERWGFRFSPAPAAGADAGASAAGGAAAGPAVLVTHAPEVLGSALAPADLKAVIAEAESGSRAGAAPSAVLHILTFKACRRAVKFGDPLSRAQMARLLRDLSACDFPFQCAHGRPTLYPFLGLGALRQMRSTLHEESAKMRAPPLAGFLKAAALKRK